MKPQFRVLLVDDFEPFRRFLHLALRGMPELTVVGEAADGLEAVQKAQDLQPDLILLDIGLPGMNGLAAAEQIRVLSPQSRILFISLESSFTAVRESFRVGGSGYIHKVSLQEDLAPAIEAVLSGRQFVSKDVDLSDATRPQSRHEVQFYSSDAVFLDAGARFISQALNENGAAIAATTRAHADSLLQRLKAESVDVDKIVHQGRYFWVDVEEMFCRMTINGKLEAQRINEVLEPFVTAAAKATGTQNPRVAIFGECAALLCVGGNAREALQMEKQGQPTAGVQQVDVMCAYPLSAFQSDEELSIYKSICESHTAVFSR